MDFTDKTVVVAGAAGVVASGVVRKYLDAGATVVATSRRRDKLEALARSIGIGPDEPFIAVEADFGDEDAATAARKAVLDAAAGRAIDHVVASVGFVLTGPAPTETPLPLFERAIAEGLYTNVLAAKALLPLVRDRAGASYTMVSGGLAHFPPPVPNLWMATIKNAAVNALTYGLASEAASAAVRVNTLCIHFAVAPVGAKKNQLGMPAAHDTLALAPAFLALAAGQQRGQVVCLAGWDDVSKLAA